MDVMSYTVQGILFAVAVICFALAACNVPSRINLVALGLAFFVVVFAWNALALGGVG